MAIRFPISADPMDSYRHIQRMINSSQTDRQTEQTLDGNKVTVHTTLYIVVSISPSSFLFLFNVRAGLPWAGVPFNLWY